MVHPGAPEPPRSGRLTAPSPQFTVVFAGDLRAFDRNPFHVDTPFGRPVAVGVGNAFDELEALADVEEVEHLRNVLREIAMRPAGPNRNKWVERMERAALCALEWLDRGTPTQDIEAALAARKLEDLP